MIDPITGDDIYRRVLFQSEAPDSIPEEGGIHEVFSRLHPDFVAVRFVYTIPPHPETMIKIVDCKREMLEWKDSE
jgi:hypothetical protein